MGRSNGKVNLRTSAIAQFASTPPNMSPLTHIDSAHGVEDGKSVDAVVVGGCGQAPPPSVPARPASAVPANAETWALLRQLPLDVSRRIVAQGVSQFDPFWYLTSAG